MGKISSLQSLGTLDGPGVRYVVFFQGCPLRCACCHNPETHDFDGGKEYTADEIVANVIKCREYFGKDGGITISGGEPLLQAEFAKEIFTKCKANGINTCLDTSGCILNNSVKELLKYTDYCMLDIKYNDEYHYKKYVGCSIQTPLDFLKYLNEQKINTRIRRVIIPGINDSQKDINNFKKLLENFEAEKIELLPFKKICQTKYDNLGLVFPFKDIPAADVKNVEWLQKQLNGK